MPSPLRARRESAASGPKTAVVAGGAGSGNRPLFGRLFDLFRSTRPEQPRTVADPHANALLAFRSEATLRSEPPPIAAPVAPPIAVEVATAPQSSWRLPTGDILAPRFVRPALIALAVVVVAGLTALAIRFPVSRFVAATPQVGNLTINTRPLASEVLVDGVKRGTTPLTLSLAAGPHTVVVRSGRDERVVPLTIAAGADVTHNFEMKAAEPAALLGRMSVATDPPGARVAVDGRPRGTSPITVADLTAEEHKVTVTSEAGSAERTVMVTAGSTASVVFSLTKVAGPVGGWLSISSPFDVEVFENDDPIGSSGASRIMLAAGRHNITLSSRALGFTDTRRIDVAAGKTTAIRVEAPKVSVSVNARPWADIVLDGNAVGQTPIANLPVAIGSHEIVFTHPELGQRKETVTVSAKGPNRIAVDLTK
jgi:hypothetical protein